MNEQAERPSAAHPSDPGGSQERAAFLASILHSSTEYSIIATDLEGTSLSWNEGARRNFGYSADEMVGTHIASVLEATADVDRRDVDRLLATASSTGKAEAVFECARKNGERFSASFMVTSRRDERARDVGYVVIAHDITEELHLARDLDLKNRELHEQNRRFQEANRLRSEFLANMSHELRTPLNGIIGLAELMHDGKVGSVSSDHKEYLGDILTSSTHLLQLINDVLDLAKVESGKTEFRPESVDLAHLIADVRGIVRTIAAEKRILVTWEVDPRVAELVIDPAKLKQVLYNFLSNALKFTHDDGRVVIRAMPQGEDEFRLEVEDSGIGIRLEDFGRLFVEFEQLDASASKKYRGTGLGLALTRRLVEAQGGKVGVTSVIAKGSTFFAVLPRVSKRITLPPRHDVG